MFQPSGRLFPVRTILTAILFSATAYGLDPDRKLTQYIHRIWQTPQDLPQADIFSLGQTPDGYLLLGTHTGLLRFDGVRFTVIEGESRAPLKDVGIRSLFVDSQLRIWLGTNGAGLVQLDNGLVTQYTQESGLPLN